MSYGRDIQFRNDNNVLLEYHCLWFGKKAEAQLNSLTCPEFIAKWGMSRTEICERCNLGERCRTTKAVNRLLNKQN